MSKKLFAACLVIAAFAVMPSLASANPILTQPTGTAMAAGETTLSATNVGETVFETSTGTLRCTTADLTGTLKSNVTATGFKGEIKTVTFAGTGTTTYGERECTGSNFFTPNTTVTPGASLPWCIEANAPADTFQITGGACGGGNKGITFVLDITGIGQCAYERPAAVPGTLVTHGAGFNENTLAITNVAWTREPGMPEICPVQGNLTMRFSITSGGNPVFISS